MALICNTTATAAGAIRFTSVPTEYQPGLGSTNFSPKASLSFDPNKEWNVTASFGEAYRYPTVTELYQNITVAASRPSPIRFSRRNTI